MLEEVKGKYRRSISNLPVRLPGPKEPKSETLKVASWFSPLGKGALMNKGKETRGYSYGIRK